MATLIALRALQSSAVRHSLHANSSGYVLMIAENAQLRRKCRSLQARYFAQSFTTSVDVNKKVDEQSRSALSSKEYSRAMSNITATTAQAVVNTESGAHDNTIDTIDTSTIDDNIQNEAHTDSASPHIKHNVDSSSPSSSHASTSTSASAWQTINMMQKKLDLDDFTRGKATSDMFKAWNDQLGLNPSTVDKDTKFEFTAEQKSTLYNLIYDWTTSNGTNCSGTDILRVWRYIKSIPNYTADKTIVDMLLDAVSKSAYVNPILANNMVDHALDKRASLQTRNKQLAIWAASSWKNEAKASNAIRIYTNIKRNNTPDLDTFTHMLNLLSGTENIYTANSCQALLKEIESRFGVDSQLYQEGTIRVLDAFASCENGVNESYFMLHEYIKSDQRIQVSKLHFLSVMAGYAKFGRFDEVTKVFQELLEWLAAHDTLEEHQKLCADDMIPVILAYSRCNNNSDRAHAAQSLFVTLKNASMTVDRNPDAILLRPTIGLYNALLSVWSGEQGKDDIIAATKLLRVLEADPNVEINTDSYNSILKLWSKCDKLKPRDNVEAIINHMVGSKNDRIKPNIDSYNRLFYVYSRDKEYRQSAPRLDALFDHLVNASESKPELRPNDSSYAIAMKTWIKYHNPSRTLFYFDLMIRQILDGNEQVRPSINMYFDVIRALGELDRNDDAIQLLDIIVDDYLTGELRWPPKRRLFEEVIFALSKSTKKTAASLAQGVVQRMLRLSKRHEEIDEPDMHTYNMLLICWSRSLTSDAPYRAESVLDYAVLHPKLQHHISSFTYRQIMVTWSNSSLDESVDRVLDLFSDMEKARWWNKKITPDNLVYTAILKTISKSALPNAPDIIMSFLKDMKENCMKDSWYLPPTAYHYSSLIDAYAERKDPEQAESTLRELLKQTEISPIVTWFHATMKAYMLRPDIEDAPLKVESLMREMCNTYNRNTGRNLKPNSDTFTVALNTWYRSSRSDAVRRAEALMKEQIALSEGDTSSLDEFNHNLLCFLRIIVKMEHTLDLDEKKRYVKEIEGLMKIYKCDLYSLRQELSQFEASFTAEIATVDRKGTAYGTP